MWRAPGKAHPSLAETLLSGPGYSSFWLRARPRPSRLTRHGSALSHYPKWNRYWYRHFAVRPTRQDKGLGGAAIRAGLGRSANMSVETAKDANVALYQKLGFKVVDEWDVPKGGPPFLVHALREMTSLLAARRPFNKGKAKTLNLARFPLERNRSSDQKSCKINTGTNSRRKSLSTFAEFALTSSVSVMTSSPRAAVLSLTSGCHRIRLIKHPRR